MSSRRRSKDWTFPLPRTHTGVLQGNGVLGVMIWGEGNRLRVTLNRADFWDRRGGKGWSEAMNFADIRRLLEAGDEAGIRRIFADEPAAGRFRVSTRLPFGRFELVFRPDACLERATPSFENGRVSVFARVGQAERAITFDLSMAAPVLLVEADAADLIAGVEFRTAWDEIAAELAAADYVVPQRLDDGEHVGWAMTRPADRPLAAVCRREGANLWIACDYGDGDDIARAAGHACAHIAAARRGGVDRFRADAAAWWAAYWRDVPRVVLPDTEAQFLYDYGLWKFAGLTHPAGIAAGLQGPWAEEYQLPPWSADYHFNVNVQMCYQPAYQANRLEHLRPLFDLIHSWRDTLRENAYKFVGVEDGVLLPHAVDDRCNVIGSFWTGTIDHACTAWVAKMMYDYWLYGGDRAFLRERAYPFMAGAMRVYERMLDDVDADRVSLPISVSPEYRGAQHDAWGRDASFQLAAIHWLLEALAAAAAELGETPRPEWAAIGRKLPRATVGLVRGKRRILLWEGTPLEESHRHHSHLAAIYPFDTIDADDPEWAEIVRDSIEEWIFRGTGLWTGWCMPWAAMLHARVGHREMPALILEIWRRTFVNEGHGTLHDAAFPGLTLMGTASDPTAKKEMMQIDAGMGAAAAILDALVHCRRGVAYVQPGVPAAWRDLVFDGVRTEGGFLFSSTRRGGRIADVRVQATRRGVIRLANPYTPIAAMLKTCGRTWESDAAVIDVLLEADQTLEVTPVTAATQ